jgi:hypothetical protein
MVELQESGFHIVTPDNLLQVLGVGSVFRNGSSMLGHALPGLKEPWYDEGAKEA